MENLGNTASADYCIFIHLFEYSEKSLKTNSSFQLRLMHSIWSFVSIDEALGVVKSYDQTVKYGDAFLFAIENKPIYSRLWKDVDVDQIVLVHNDERYKKSLEEESQKRCEFVLIPDSNSFSRFDEIIKKIMGLVNNQADNIRSLVIVSAGPCGKAIAYTLAKNNIWCIDAGHCFQNPLHIMS